MGLLDSLSEAITNPTDILKRTGLGIGAGGTTNLNNWVKNPASMITDPVGNAKNWANDIIDYHKDPFKHNPFQEAQSVWRGLFGGDDGGPAPESEEDKRKRLLLEANQKYAKDFREGIPEQERKMIGQLGKEASRGLYEGTQSIRQGASARGALYGGGRQAQEQKLRANVGGQLAAGSQKVKTGLLQTAKQLEDQAVQSGIDLRNQQQNLFDQAYQNAMAEMQQEAGLWGNLLGAVGGVVGGVYGGPGGAMAGYAGGNAVGSQLSRDF